MEYLDGGELFERVAGEDFNLTESDCCQFMKQICRFLSWSSHYCCYWYHCIAVVVIVVIIFVVATFNVIIAVDVIASTLLLLALCFKTD